MRVFQHLFATALISIWLILRLVRRRGLPETPLNPLLYLCVIVWFVSALASLDPRMALENLWFPVTNLLLFCMMVDLVQSGQEGLLVETQFLLAAVVVMLAGIQLGSWFFGWGFATPTVGWASVLGKDIPLPLTSPRLFVPLGVTTWLAAYTAPLAVLIGAWGLAARRRSTRNVLILLALLLVLIMLLTDSRGGWISLGAGIVVFGGLHTLRSERLRQRVRRYALPLLIAAALIVAVSVFVVIRIGEDPGHATGDVLRFDLWRGAVKVIDDHPFLGVGPGMFGTAYRLSRDPTTVDNRLGTAHNFYLNSVAENGVVGGLILLAVGAILLRTWWKLWRTAETPMRQTHLEAALAALIGFGVQSFFDTFTSMTLVLLALGLTAYCVTQPRSRIDAPLKGSIAAGWASLIVVLLFGAGMLRSDQAQAAFIASTNGSPDQIQQALALDPGLRLYTLQAAYITGLNGDPAQAVAEYQQALSLEPTWDTGWINLAALLERQGKTAEALDALQKAIQIDNHNGALLLWARLAEASSAAPADAIRDAYTHDLEDEPAGNLPLSLFWSQTDLRKQALASYEQTTESDLHYRIVAAQDPTGRASLVPTNPVSAGDWWVVGEYALTVENDAAKADQAFTQAIALRANNGFLGDYYVSRARSRITTDPQGAARDLKVAQLYGAYNESINAVRARLAASPDEQRRLLAAAVPPPVIDQDFEGVLFAGRVADFRVLPEMRPPGPGHSVLQPWYDLAASYLAARQSDQAANVYRAILDRAPEETDARDQLAKLTGG